MANTIKTYVSDGVRTSYPVDFTLGYLNDRSFVYVYQGDDPTIQLSYTWTDDENINLDAPVPSGEEFNIRRIVPRTRLINDYVDGAQIRERNLDQSYSQALMIIEEMEDGFITSIPPWVIQGDLTVHGTITAEALLNAAGDDYYAIAAQAAQDAEASKVAAEVSKVAAEAAQVEAEAAEAATQLLYTDFNDRYYGPLAEDPTNKPSGGPSTAGDLYFNTLTLAMLEYTGSAWVPVTAAAAAYVTYDPTSVPLEASNVQDALDEVATMLPTFDSVAAMKAANIRVGTQVVTKGYTTAGDQGDAKYTIHPPGTPADEWGDHTASNGNVAVLTTNTPSVEQYGGNFTAAYAKVDTLRVLTEHTENNLTISKPTTFLGGKITASGVLTIDAEITANNVPIIDTTGVTTFTVNALAVSEIKNNWFSATDYGNSQTVYGHRAGAALLGQKGTVGTDYNTLVGFRCGERMWDARDTAFFGPFAGASAVSATYATGVGYGTFRGKENPPSSGQFDDITLTNAHGFGISVFGDATTVSASVGVGAVGRNAQTVENVVGIGAYTLRTGAYLKQMVVIGSGAGYSLGSTGAADDSALTTMVGYNVGEQNITQAYRSTLIGARSGYYAQQCDHNTWLGEWTGPESATYANVKDTICVGMAAKPRADNSITIGNNLVNPHANSIMLGSTAQTQTWIAGIYNATNAAAANVYIGSDDRLYRSTSSLEYKNVIEPMSLDWAKRVLDFEPILYKPKENAEDPTWSYYGYGAEQVAAIDPRYVQMAKKPVGTDPVTGRPILAQEASPNGVMYDRIVCAQGMLIKDLLTRIQALEAKTP